MRKDPLFLPYLLSLLRTEPEALLRQIDDDEAIKKTPMRDGLIVANAKSELAYPTLPHELLAKGIVFTRGPYTLVSLPLVKMFNLHLHNRATDLFMRLNGMEEDSLCVRVWEKLDGTMIQLFAHQDRVHFATRGAGEGSELSEEYLSYCEEARRVCEKHYPQLLDPLRVEGYTFTFELLHPDAPIVTRYALEEPELHLHAIFDHVRSKYLDATELEAFAGERALKVCPHYEPEELAALMERMEEDDTIPEGVVLSLEYHGEVLHRVKHKSRRYVARHGLKYDCTHKRVCRLCMEDAELFQKERFTAYLVAQGLDAEEELFALYMDYHRIARRWFGLLLGIRQGVEALVVAYVLEQGKDALRDNDYYGQLARRFQEDEEGLRILPLVMSHARGKTLTLFDVAKRFPPYKGFKPGEIRQGPRSLHTL